MLLNNTNYRKLMLSLSFLTILYISSYRLPSTRKSHSINPFVNHTHPKLSSSKLSVINSVKTVFMNYPWFWGVQFELGRLGFINAGCEVSNCVLTTNISYVKDYDFDAFMMHVPSQYGGRTHVPGKRRRDQIYILFSTEPPVHMPPLDPFENYFNWTMTYLSDSDIHIPYGRIEPLPGAPTTDSERISIQKTIRLFSVNPAKGKSKLAIWTVSNCNARSNRMDYVKELQKYVDIDILSSGGKCGKEDFCPKKQNNVCLDAIEQRYKFYLAFENSICREYVTEKFFNSMGRNLVPIVLGGTNYSAIAPKHSYINALDYTPRQLAEYLQKLDKDDSLYAEYFWWKPYYRVVNLVQTNREAFCKLCAALHANPIEEKVVKRVKKWYISDSHCINRPDFKSKSVGNTTSTTDNNIRS